MCLTVIFVADVADHGHIFSKALVVKVMSCTSRSAINVFFDSKIFVDCILMDLRTSPPQTILCLLSWYALLNYII